jgi:hypothetical protein
LLGELVSASGPVAVLINPKGDYAEQQAKDLQAGAPRIGRQILILHASSERDIDNAFKTLSRRHGIRLRQSYLRIAKRAAMMAGRYAHAPAPLVFRVRRCVRSPDTP